ncbi:sterile alpha motif domain-containing protein 10-like [Gouania willdenowi]|uniref:sterile alpha motif domain-containing protein 10-like n=1 Tax=Gouania willdenowi TaxID=441366 RepID=UPI001055BFB5|nr:sterile alpha motif domain-containing protein 10-like [Gouania willdenowi]XP_028295334.1 sterile alpha motif domain-containing protein 10-like [Gouania willdenowi]
MDEAKRTSSWSVEDVLDWVQTHYPHHMMLLHKAILKHCISGRALLRLRAHHLELLGVDDEDQQEGILQDVLLLRVREEMDELSDICSECFSS